MIDGRFWMVDFRKGKRKQQQSNPQIAQIKGQGLRKKTKVSFNAESAEYTEER